MNNNRVEVHKLTDQEVKLPIEIPIDSIQKVKSVIESLYLVPTPCNYQVLFPFWWFSNFNRIFDQIIKEHGIREVEFEYDETNHNFDKNTIIIKGNQL